MKILLRVIVILLFITTLGMNVEARRIDEEGLPGVNETGGNVICPDEMGDAGSLEADISNDSSEGDRKHKKRKRKAARRAFKKKLVSLRVAYKKFKVKKRRKDGLHPIYTSPNGIRIAVLIKDGAVVTLVAKKNGKRLVTRIVKEEEITMEEDETVDPEEGTSASCPEGTEPCVIVVEDEETGQSEYYAWCCDVIDV